MRVIEGAMEKTISDKGSEQTINSYGGSLEDWFEAPMAQSWFWIIRRTQGEAYGK